MNEESAQGILVIRSAADLRMLRATPRLLAARPLQLDLPGLSAETARTAAARMVAYANACGCALSASAMIGTFGAIATWLAFSHGVLTIDFLWRLPLALLCGLAAAGLGKWLGISYARSRLKREIEKLLALQSNHSTIEV